MRNRVYATAALAVALCAAAAPASAADSSTTVTATLTGGSLTISAPSTAALSGSAAAGSILTAPMGKTTVADSRGSLLGWNVTAVTLTGSMTTSTGDSIPLAATGPLGLVTGTITAEGGSLLSGVGAGAGGNLSTTAVAVATAALNSGGGTYSYDPTLTLTVPPNTKAGAYQVTVVQTVS